MMESRESLKSFSLFSFFILVLCLSFFSSMGCSIVEVKQDHYRRDFGKLPQKETISVQDAGAVSVGATEMNKGLNWIYYKGVKELDSRVKVLLDFSYTVMGFLGVAWESIDWDNPDEWFKQAEQKKKEMEEALKNEKERALKLEKETNDLLHNLAQRDKIIKDKDAEMQARDGKWSAKLSGWFKFFSWIIGLILFLGLLYWLYTSAIKMVAGLPLKVAMFGGKTVSKGIKQVVEGVQEARLRIKHELENGATEEEKKTLEKALNILHSSLDRAKNDDVHKLIDAIKDKHGMERLE